MYSRLQNRLRPSALQKKFVSTDHLAQFWVTPWHEYRRILMLTDLIYLQSILALVIIYEDQLLPAPLY
jgi:hypothetical protein